MQTRRVNINKLIKQSKDMKTKLMNLPKLGSLSIANNCFANSSVVNVFALPYGTGLCVSCDPGALLCELFDPNEDVDADSELSLLPFYKKKKMITITQKYLSKYSVNTTTYTAVTALILLFVEWVTLWKNI